MPVFTTIVVDTRRGFRFESCHLDHKGTPVVIVTAGVLIFKDAVVDAVRT